jgi:hypothetical protein
MAQASIGRNYRSNANELNNEQGGLYSLSLYENTLKCGKFLFKVGTSGKLKARLADYANLNPGGVHIIDLLVIDRPDWDPTLNQKQNDQKYTNVNKKAERELMKMFQDRGFKRLTTTLRKGPTEWFYSNVNSDYEHIHQVFSDFADKNRDICPKTIKNMDATTNKKKRLVKNPIMFKFPDLNQPDNKFPGLCTPKPP